MRGTQTEPLIVQIVPAAKSEQEAGQNERERSEKPSSDWWIVGLTGFLGVIGSVQTIVFWIQARRLRQTIIKMDEVAADASRIAQAQVRAYVSFIDAKVTMKKIYSRSEGIYIAPFFTIQMKNFGNSPAIRYRYYTTAVFMGVEDISLRAGSARGYAFGDRDIAASEVVGYEDFPIAYAALRGNDIVWFEKGTVGLVTTFYTVFTDVFGIDVFGSTSFFASFTMENMLNEVQASPIATSAEKMAESLVKMKDQKESGQT